jgi:hypothetical protein
MGPKREDELSPRRYEGETSAEEVMSETTEPTPESKAVDIEEVFVIADEVTAGVSTWD